VGCSVVAWSSLAGNAGRAGSIVGLEGSDERTPNDLEPVSVADMALSSYEDGIPPLDLLCCAAGSDRSPSVAH
jgi:hypothetical protein